MNLAAHYNKMYQKSVETITQKGVDIDTYIKNPNDDRFGLTLIIKPDEKISRKIIRFTNGLRRIEPNQYYYPLSDLHITVLSIISCRDGFKLSDIDTSNYINLIAGCLKNSGGFKVEMKGVTASPSCIMIQGFPLSNNLELIRNELRSAFKNSPLTQSMDERYLLKTAHASVVRFNQPLTDAELFLNKLHNSQELDFGTFDAKSIQLVYNDWYQRADSLQTLYSFNFG